jgi:hypothetical protein
VFFTRATGGLDGYVAAAVLVIVVAATPFLLTFLLVYLLPKHIRQPDPAVEDVSPATIS